MSGGIRVKKIKRLMTASLISIFALSAVGCNMVAKTDAAIKKSTVAKVNSDTVTRGQLDARMEPVLIQMKSGNVDVASAEGKKTLAEEKKKMLDTMIMETIIVQKAKDNKIMPTEAKLTEAVNKKLEEIKKGFVDEKKVPDETKFTAALKQSGFTEVSLKEYLRMTEIKQIVSDFITKDVVTDDVKAKAEYDANPTKYTEKPNTIHLAHILLKTEAEAKAAKVRLNNKEAFATVAKAVSIDTVANEKGGDLGVVTFEGAATDGSGSTMDATFMKAAIALKVGAISEPVSTQYGFHIIQCIEKTEYPVKKFDVVKEDIKKALLETQKTTLLNESLDKWKKAAKVETEKYVKNL
jgi:foldase protein PrsA